ncbi:unnamed protein product, partial [Coccothraustes coccothraustes]
SHRSWRCLRKAVCGTFPARWRPLRKVRRLPRHRRRPPSGDSAGAASEGGRARGRRR